MLLHVIRVESFDNVLLPSIVMNWFWSVWIFENMRISKVQFLIEQPLIAEIVALMFESAKDAASVIKC